MGSKKDSREIKEVVEKIKEQGLSYTEGARQSGINVKKIYDYNYRKKRKGENGEKGGNGEQERITPEKATEAKAEQGMKRQREKKSLQCQLCRKGYKRSSHSTAKHIQIMAISA